MPPNSQFYGRGPTERGLEFGGMELLSWRGQKASELYEVTKCHT